MPKARISHNLFNIQINVTTDRRISVLQVIMVLLHQLPKLIKRLMNNLQEHWLREDLGPPGTIGNLFSEKSLACPECGSVRVNRKDWKPRKPVVPVLGEIEIEQRRVKCCKCGAIYKPYEEELGLPEGAQYTQEVLIEGIQNVMMMSYERASAFTEGTPSPGTLHRAVQDMSPEIGEEELEHTLVVMDATDVPRWKESGQISLTLAHEIKRGPEVYGRSTLKRTVVAVAAGREEEIKELLESEGARALLHDGKLDVDELCDVEGRCLWHVPYTVHHLLYRDGITGEENKRRCGKLSRILFDEELTAGECAARLMEWAENQEPEAPEAAGHVKRALEGLVNVKEKSELFEVLTTSCMERQMLEINKRFENGGGWTPEGAEALLRHLQLWLFEPEKWLQQVLPDDGVEMPDLLYNSLI